MKYAAGANLLISLHENFNFTGQNYTTFAMLQHFNHKNKATML